MAIQKTVKGKVWKYGDNVDTDVILPGRYCNLTKVEDIKPHAMEDLDATFAKEVKPGDIIVAGDNFGCGSSREIAPLAIKSSGVSIVIAESFARIFYRNCINIGLPILASPEAAKAIKAGDVVEADLSTGKIRVPARNLEFSSVPFPEFVHKIIEKGGLVEYLRETKFAGAKK